MSRTNIKSELAQTLRNWIKYADTLGEHCYGETHSTDDVIAVVLKCHNDLADIMNKYYSLQNNSSEEKKNE